MKRDDLHRLISESLGYKCPTKQCSQCVEDHERPLEYSDSKWPNWSESEVASAKLLDMMPEPRESRPIDEYGKWICTAYLSRLPVSKGNRKTARLLAYVELTKIYLGPKELED